jgi:hypothetical protein
VARNVVRRLDSMSRILTTYLQAMQVTLAKHISAYPATAKKAQQFHEEIAENDDLNVCMVIASVTNLTCDSFKLPVTNSR